MERLKSQFKVGDKVVCINDSFTVRDPKCMFINFLKKREKYTVRGFCSMGISLHLEEVRNEPLPGRNEIWFYNWLFCKKLNPIIKIKSLSKSQVS